MIADVETPSQLKLSKPYQDLLYHYTKTKTGNENNTSSYLISAIDKMIQKFDNSRKYQFGILKYTKQMDLAIKVLG